MQYTLMMKLSDLNCGESSKVIQISNQPKFMRRINDLGIVEGVVITYVARAPLGDPMLIKVRDFMLAIRLDDAKKITVEKL